MLFVGRHTVAAAAAGLEVGILAEDRILESADKESLKE